MVSPRRSPKTSQQLSPENGLFEVRGCVQLARCLQRTVRQTRPRFEFEFDGPRDRLAVGVGNHCDARFFCAKVGDDLVGRFCRLPPARQRKTLRSKRFPTTIQILRINSLNWLGKANKYSYTNGANRANLICLARPSTFSVQIPYQFMSNSYHRNPCLAALG